MCTTHDTPLRARSVLELYQAEWCPYSRQVRQRLTELGVDYIARQVPVARDARQTVIGVSGQSAIPVLIDRGSVITGSQAILTHLDRRYPEGGHATEHRFRAAEKRHQELAIACRELTRHPARDRDR